MKRRHFLTISAGTIGGLLLYSLDGKTSQVVQKQENLRIPLSFFDESEALLVAAAVSRIFPDDESGPGAKQAGVVIYIDRHLAGPYGSDRHRYVQPPFENGPPELGYQGKLTPREIYRDGLNNLAGFVQLPPSDQDLALEQIETSLFFSLLRQHTIEGMFCDPLHGGNVDMVGWQLVGFPGPRMSNFDDVDQHFGVAFRPEPVSLFPSELQESKG